MNRSMNILSSAVIAAVLTLAAVPVRAKAGPATAQREVMGVVDALFVAMTKHDVEASRKLILPGAGFVVIGSDGKVKMEHDSDYLDSLAKHKEAVLERIWHPQVAVHDNIAHVWAPYDFHFDGKLSHCGIDSFSLVRTGDGWRIAGISYSVQKEGCTSPLDAKK
jgi:hypothetical protein